MKVCLAGTGLLRRYPDELTKADYFLESFYSIQDWQIPYFKKAKFFLLDSGAFTFMNSAKRVDFDYYLEQYIKFINKYNIEYFFELDLDNILGYDKVKEMRTRLEKATGKRCIPVWHKSRGIDDFVETVKKYKYIAIGGIVTKEISKKDYKFFAKLINIAHKHGCKIHGLGFTSTPLLKKYRFDSVDSTTWVNGGRFGNICKIVNGEIIQVHDTTKRCTQQDKLMLYNYEVWCKYQSFADKYL